ncbi:MAG: aldehyde dehydrogenase family protein [Thermoanaerobaculia bacterium]
MPSTKGFKITYATLAAPAEEVHVAFETAANELQGALGQTHPIWIGGEPSLSEEVFENRSPTDRRVVVGSFQRASASQVAAAIGAAHRAFGEWSRMPWQERLSILRTAAENISSHRFELAALMSLEVGKNRFEALADAEEAADLLRYYCQQMEDAAGFDRPMGQLAPNEKTRDILRPYGVWVVISPFNFPVALAAGMAAGALVAGNTVVLKPASEAPASALKLYEIVVEAGLPAGVLNYLSGSGSEVGRTLVQDSRVSGLVFTGSKEVGMRIFRRFNDERPRPCYLELGGKNPAIVTARADLEKAAEGVARSAFGFGGQKCSACSRVYVDRSVATAFKELLRERTVALAIGDPLRRESFLGPVINEAAVRKFERCVAAARRDGEILFGGDVLGGEEFAHGFFVTPTAVTGLPEDHWLVREELFLPFLYLGEVESLEQAIELSNRSEYGLTAGIFSEDLKEVETFFDSIESGVTYANRRSGATTGAWPGVNPFCGWKSSGSTGKGVCGPYYVSQFLREQSRTLME